MIMIKEKGFIYFIKYYCIIQLAVFALFLYLGQDLIISLFHFITQMTPDSIFYDLYNSIIPLFMVIIWFLISFSIWRDKYYLYRTGRNFLKDRSKYKRTFQELLEYFSDADPLKLDTSSFPKYNGWKNVNGIILGTYKNKLISLPSTIEGNFAIMGPPGSGKTSGLGIINAMSFGGSVFAVDIKGDLFSYVSKNSPRKIARFCPDHPEALIESYHFDPLAGIHNMNITDKKIYLENISTILIPDDGGEAGSYFSSRARKMMQGICHLILHENPNATFPDIIHSILKGNIFEYVTNAIDSDCIEAAESLSSFYGNNEKNITSAYDALCTALVNFSNPILDELLTPNGKCISVDTLEKGTDVYLQINQEHLEAYAPLFTLIIQKFSTDFTKRPDSSSGVKNRPILMLLDEFPQLTFSYKLINSNLSTLRSKSIICMLIQQNLSQLQHRYQDTGSRSILGNCNYQIILGSNDINSSKVFSDTFGTRKVLKICNNESTSQKSTSGRSVQEATEKVFPPEYFGDLPSRNAMIIYFKGKYIECKKLNCYKNKEDNVKWLSNIFTIK